jgi:DNA-binding GntR family transcriptional regulator
MAKLLRMPLDGESLAEQAYRALKQKIFDFSFLPGDRLSESDLAESLGLSRTPLRQALQRLQHEGFVEPQPKIGWVLSPLRFDRIDALYDFRILIECFAAKVCCQKDFDRTRLQTLIKTWGVSKSHRVHDPVRIGQQDEDFHEEIVALAANPEISKTHKEITEKIRIIRRLDFSKTHRIDATYDEHFAILKAIQSRRVDEAQRLLTAHIEQSKIEVRKITLDMLYNARANGIGLGPASAQK